jgi:carboxylesterase type B
MNDPSELAVAFDVVVVAGNYRVDALGWLAHPALVDDNNGTVGNFGMHDQRAAMKWTQANIKRFGGDPLRVTLAGESAGGFSVCQHLASPASSGLFSNAIMESGACDSGSLLVFGKTDAEAFALVYADAVGCPSSNATPPALVAECLRNLGVTQILTPYVRCGGVTAGVGIANTMVFESSLAWAP